MIPPEKILSKCINVSVFLNVCAPLFSEAMWTQTAADLTEYECVVILVKMLKNTDSLFTLRLTGFV